MWVFYGNFQTASWSNCYANKWNCVHMLFVSTPAYDLKYIRYVWKYLDEIRGIFLKRFNVKASITIFQRTIYHRKYKQT